MVRLLFLFLFPALVQAQDLSEIGGSWKGAIMISGEELPVEFNFMYDGGELDGTIDIPQQNAFNLPVEVVEATSDSLIFQFQTGTGPAVFYGERDIGDEKISGIFEQAGMSFPFSITRKERAENPGTPAGEEVIIPTTAGQAAGTILLTDRNSPLIILLNGSGSQDRDETISGFRIFGEMASFLFDEGYSSFRYDDRGIGKSSGNEDATLEELAGDLTEIISYLKENYTGRFSKMILLGHSQGGWVATLAAEQTEVDGIIFMASPFQTGDRIINQQIEKISDNQGISSAVVEQNLVFQEEIYAAARTGSGWDAVEENLSSRLQEQIDQLPQQKRESLGSLDYFIQNQVDRQLSSAKSRWFKSFIEFDPSSKISGLNIPMLALFGDKDVQVLAAPNAEAAEEISRNNNSLPLEMTTISNANHLFQEANTGMPGEYGMLKKSFADGFLEKVLLFLEGF